MMDAREIMRNASVLDLMYMLRQLMDMGYEKLRWLSYMSPTGLCLRCHITSQDNIARNYEPISFDASKIFAVSTDRFEKSSDILLMADGFKRAYRELLELCEGKDTEYKKWFELLLKEVETGKLPKFIEEYGGIPDNKIMVGHDLFPAPPRGN